jgi:hypothetical protein
LDAQPFDGIIGQRRKVGALKRGSWFARFGFAALFLGLGVALSLGVFGFWLATYPDATDPKNIYYVLWKHNLNNDMDLDNALGAMSHDVSPIRQVQGLTRRQLTARFRYIRTIDEATPYLRGCYSTPGAAAQVETHGDDRVVGFLRDSPWLVVMQNRKAIDLILCKGY